MKRDMDLVRDILLDVETKGQPTVGEQTIDIAIEGREIEEVQYHLWLLVEAGLIDAHLTTNPQVHTPTRVRLRRLTWQGHEFLDTIRDPEIWKKTKQGTAAAGGFTLDLLKNLATGFIRKQIKEKTGVDV